MYPSWPRSSDPVGAAAADDFCPPGRCDEFLIEGVGIVHVSTEVPDHDPFYARTDVFVQRYEEGKLTNPVRLNGSVCERPFALSMHTHWSDVERLCKCLRGDRAALSIQDIDWEVDDPTHPEDTADPETGYAPRAYALYSRASRKSGSDFQR